MTNLNIFGDDRKIPKLSIKVKIKVKTRNQEETATWNTVFGYIMRKPRTKLEFLAVNSLRKLPMSEIKLQKIKYLLTSQDFEQLSKIEHIFDNVLTSDTKAFILAVLKITVADLQAI